MSTYPGNPSLSTAVKDRVSSTFQQALTLFKQGRTAEAISGCNLILQMDPQFEPGRKLLEKAKNPALPIDVDNLIPAGDPLSEARDAMAARDYPRVIQLTTEVLTNDLMNDEARVLGDQARERLEAAPFIEQFARKCESLLNAGNVDAARNEIEKARALDPAHPEIARIDKMIAAKTPQSFSFDAGPSFVVDNPPAATGRGTAQAADFGFTFEEEKEPVPAAAPSAPAASGGFSFDTPAADSGGGFASFSFDAPDAPAAPATPAAPAESAFSFGAPAVSSSGSGAEFDFSTASIETSPEDQQKISQYLAEGDRAFDGGDYQEAIDLWSRIFLIDVTNDQASERIERAKVKRREAEQKVEGVLATAIQAFDRGDHDTARSLFNDILTTDPRNAAAQDYLNRMANTVTEGGAAGVETNYIPPSPARDIFADDPMPSSGIDIPVLPPPPSPKKETADAPAKKAPKAAPIAVRKPPMGAIITVVALIVLGVGGWFAWSKFSGSKVDPNASESIFTQANALAGQGKFDQAIAMLREIQPTDPQHDRALGLIADLQQKKTGLAQTIDGVPTAQYFDNKIAAARTALDSHDYVGAKAAFEQAMRAKPLPADLKALYDSAAQQVAKLDSAKALFAEERYTEALTNLQELAVQDPQNTNIQRMIVNAHFNLGAKALREEKTQDAVRAFDQVLQLNPGDELAKRSRDLAQRYEDEPKDLLYKIYVKYLPRRQAV